MTSVTTLESRLGDVVRYAAPSAQTAMSVASSAGCEKVTLATPYVERHMHPDRPCARIRHPRFLYIFVNRIPVTGGIRDQVLQEAAYDVAMVGARRLCHT